MNYAATYDVQSAPEAWETVSYTVRRPGCSAWERGITSFREAMRSAKEANGVCRGHVVLAEQEYIGEITSMQGARRTVLVQP